MSQTTDCFGRTSDYLGKVIRTFASGAAGVGDSAKVYAVEPVLNNVTIPMNNQGVNE